MNDISLREINKNLVSLIAEDGALLTSGNKNSDVNTMMVNWGGMGYLWHKDICFIVVRESRYTLSLIEKSQGFSLNFFTAKYADCMNYCGSVSGRDVDKFAHCGFKPKYEEDIPYIDKASLVIQCRTIYADGIKQSCFMNEDIYNRWYKGDKHEGDIHRLFIGEVIKAFVSEGN